MIKITGRGVGPDAKINGIPIKQGTHRYDLDPKDPSTAMQLEVLRDQIKVITCDCLLPCDTAKIATAKKVNEDARKETGKPTKATKKAGKN